VVVRPSYLLISIAMDRCVNVDFLPCHSISKNYTARIVQDLHDALGEILFSSRIFGFRVLVRGGRHFFFVTSFENHVFKEV
jgi:hypothetical protein